MCLVGHSSSVKENWDFFIMICACWNVFMLPISIAFNTQDETFQMISVWIDVVFIMDIIVVFRTAVLDEESGEDITDSK